MFYKKDKLYWAINDFTHLVMLSAFFFAPYLATTWFLFKLVLFAKDYEKIQAESRK